MSNFEYNFSMRLLNMCCYFNRVLISYLEGSTPMLLFLLCICWYLLLFIFLYFSIIVIFYIWFIRKIEILFLFLFFEKPSDTHQIVTIGDNILSLKLEIENTKKTSLFSKNFWCLCASVCLSSIACGCFDMKNK